MNIGPQCTIYRTDDKTITHIFLECPNVSNIWSSLDINIHNINTSNPWLLNLMKLNSKPQNRTIDWTGLMPFLLWGIWITRNKNNHNNTNFPPLLNTTMNKALEYHYLNSKSAPLQNKMTINITWHAPQKYWYKLNTDGAFNNNEKLSGLGGVFWDHLGVWIMGFQKRNTATSLLQAELQGIHEGLKIATKFNLSPLELETNSTEAINAIRHDHMVFSNTVHACRLLMHQQKDLLLRHNFREGNQVAHLLAKDATKKQYKQLTSEYPKLHASPPPFGDARNVYES